MANRHSEATESSRDLLLPRHLWFTQPWKCGDGRCTSQCSRCEFEERCEREWAERHKIND